MNKAVKIIQTYLLYAFPFVLACMAWGTFQPESEVNKSSSLLLHALWEVLSWNLMFWFVALVFFLVLLVIMPSARENTLKRLANIKERDEREEYITGRASRASYIATLSLMLLFLFFSMFQFNIYRAPENQAINGKRGTASIGIHLSLLDEARIEKNTEGEILFESKDIPLSKSAIILVFIGWQLLSFHLAARKEQVS